MDAKQSALSGLFFYISGGLTMDALLERVVEAHGGLSTWNRFEKIEATILSGGGFFPLKGFLGDPNPRRVTVWLHEERTSLLPFGAPDQRMAFTPERVAVETLDGAVVAERLQPHDAFSGHQMTTPWDPLHYAYFNGEALWTYFTTPFLLSFPGVKVDETEPWTEGTETWRVLRAHFPSSISTHSPVQDFFFGEDFQLRRHDYNVDVAGGFGAAQLTSDYIEVQGIRLPTKRRAYTRGPDRRPIRDMLMVFIDIGEISIS
jgi:hypothetical protein